jgi:hypothetical protein
MYVCTVESSLPATEEIGTMGCEIESCQGDRFKKVLESIKFVCKVHSSSSKAESQMYMLRNIEIGN